MASLRVKYQYVSQSKTAVSGGGGSISGAAIAQIVPL
jgi:hypothetical protein